MYCASPRGGLANPREGLAEGPNIHIHTHFLIYMTISVYYTYIYLITMGGHCFSIVDCHTEGLVEEAVAMGFPPII